MMSNISLALPLHVVVWIGIRFSRKSPARGLMKRHWPLGALMGTDVNARVAVESRGLDSATADGWRRPPAPETETAVVGLKSGIPDVSSAGGAVAETAIAGELVVDMVDEDGIGADDGAMVGLTSEDDGVASMAAVLLIEGLDAELGAEAMASEPAKVNA